MLLRNAGIAFDLDAARIDEGNVIASLLAEGANPRDIADTLAEMKAMRVSDRHPDALVIGCDQVLDHEGQVLQKSATREEAFETLRRLSGGTHRLLSAAVIYTGGEPRWRYVGVVRLHMRSLTDDTIARYLDRTWPGVRDSVGAYHLEGEGVRLFSRIEGQYFHVLGLPLLEILDHLFLSGEVDA
jgi:septum formation protein